MPYGIQARVTFQLARSSQFCQIGTSAPAYWTRLLYAFALAHEQGTNHHTAVLQAAVFTPSPCCVSRLLQVLQASRSTNTQQAQEKHSIASVSQLQR